MACATWRSVGLLTGRSGPLSGRRGASGRLTWGSNEAECMRFNIDPCSSLEKMKAGATGTVPSSVAVPPEAADGPLSDRPESMVNWDLDWRTCKGFASVGHAHRICASSKKL